MLLWILKLRAHPLEITEEGRPIASSPPAVVFLFIGGREFWQGVAVGGGCATQQQARQELAELQNIIAGLEFL